MKAVKWIVGLVVGAALAVILIAAIVPGQDCAGNNTWKTSEVCAK
jgi:hypothetical protein